MTERHSHHLHIVGIILYGIAGVFGRPVDIIMSQAHQFGPGRGACGMNDLDDIRLLQTCGDFRQRGGRFYLLGLIGKTLIVRLGID